MHRQFALLFDHAGWWQNFVESHSYAHRVLDVNTKDPCLDARRHMDGNLLTVSRKPHGIRDAGGRNPGYSHVQPVLAVFRQNQTAFSYESLLRQDSQVIETMAFPHFGLGPGLMTIPVWVEVETRLRCVRVPL